jgi:C-terminal processing protease CtpA/Prc
MIIMKKLSLICLAFFGLSFQSIAGEFWFQPEKAILFEISITNTKPLVTKVFNISQSAQLCIQDKGNTKSMRDRFIEAYSVDLKHGRVEYRVCKDSFPETLIQLEELPKACLEPLQSDDPKINFDALWHFYNEYYPSFEERLSEKGLTWDAIYGQFAPKVNSNTKSTDLYQVLSEMLAILRDGHTALYAPDENHDFEDDFYNLREDKKTLLQAFQNSWAISPEDRMGTVKQLGVSLIQNFNIIDKYYLEEAHHGPERSLSDDWFTPQSVYSWGVLKNRPEIGYVRILQELNFEGEQSFQEQFEQANKTIRDMMHFFRHKKIAGLVVDLRLNYGGKDAINNSFTRYLLDKKRLVQQVKQHYYGARKKTISHYLSPNLESIRPRSNQFPIYILTSQLTSSAGEILTLQLKALDKTTQIGYKTDGIFADTHTRTLPNGWIYQLPFNKNMSHDGQFYEGKGIPPEILFDESHYYLLRKYMENNQDLILDAILDNQFIR